MADSEEVKVQFILDHMMARDDAFPIQLPDKFVAAKFGITRGKGYFKVDGKVSKALIEMHVRGETTVGSYQLDSENMVKWLCWDFDPPGEVERSAKVFQYLQDTWAYPGVMLEHSGRGMHIWVFFEEMVDAGIAKRFGIDVLRQVEVACEVFPKQVRIRQGKYGNLVKLPFGINKKNGRRSEMWHPRTLADITPVKVPEKLVEAFELLEEDVEWDKPTKEYFSYPCWSAIRESGFGDGYRNAIAFRMAILFKELGLSQDMAFGAILGWNFGNGPPLSKEDIRRHLLSAYTHHYSIGCNSIRGDPMLESLCDARNCSIGNWVLKNPTTRLPRESEDDYLAWKKKFRGGA